MAELLYQQVYDDLRAAIESGAYGVGDRLPTEPELALQFRVSAITVKRALDLLRNDGMIVRRPRLGTFVTSAEPTSWTTDAATATPRQPLIGCVVTTFDDTFGTRVLEGLLDAAGDEANVIVKRTGGDGQSEDHHVRSLVRAGVDGVVLLPSSSQFVPPSVLELVTRRFPVVMLDRLFDGIPVSAIASDNVGAAKAATEHLISLGHQRIAMVGSASTVSTVTQRRLGYLRAHAEAHVPLNDGDELRSIGATVPGSSVSVEEDIARLQEFIAERPEVTAFLALEYNIALLIREACRREGLHVPDDVSIACFDHPTAFADAELFRFTHIEQDQRGIGAAAIRQLLAQLDDPGQATQTLVPAQLVLGRSTAPVRAGRAVPAP